MSDLRTAAQQALEALKNIDKEFSKHGRQHWPEAVKARAAIAPLRAALAEPVQEPVAAPLAEWQINDLIEDLNTVDEVHEWSFRQGVYAAEKHHGVKP